MPVVGAAGVAEADHGGPAQDRVRSFRVGRQGVHAFRFDGGECDGRARDAGRVLPGGRAPVFFQDAHEILESRVRIAAQMVKRDARRFPSQVGLHRRIKHASVRWRTLERTVAQRLVDPLFEGGTWCQDREQVRHRVAAHGAEGALGLGIHGKRRRILAVVQRQEVQALTQGQTEAFWLGWRQTDDEESQDGESQNDLRHTSSRTADAWLFAGGGVSGLFSFHSSKHPMRDISVDVGQTEVAAGVAVGEAVVIHTQGMQEGGVEVVHVGGLVDGGVAEVVGGAVGEALFHAAGHPDGKGLGARLIARHPPRRCLGLT